MKCWQHCNLFKRTSQTKKTTVWFRL